MSVSEENFFVVIEGLDGSGKTGISSSLLQALRQTHGDQVQLTFEPHDPSAAGLFIRQTLSKQIKNVAPITLALAFALNRMDHNQRVINPFLDDNSQRIIISDRYYLSSLVYQAVPPLTFDDIMGINRWARQPDLIIFLDVKPSTSYRRMRNRTQDKELFEHKLGESREKYQQAIQFLRERGDNIVEIDANPDFNTVLNSVLDALIEHGPDWLRVQRALLPAAEDADSTIELSADSGSLKAVLQDAREQSDGGNLTDALAQIIDTLPYAELARVFSGSLTAAGYRIGEPLASVDLPACALEYDIPGGITQHGTALILGENQRYDQVTRQIQAIVNNVPSDLPPGIADVRHLSDFMIVLDTRTHSAISKHYERDASEPRLPMSPSVKIMDRHDLAAFIAAMQ